MREAYALDEVCFVPCGVPPHRNATPGAAAHHRLEMVRLAVADNPGLGVSDLEVMRPGASYSIDTVRHFSARLGPGDALYLILGLDAFLLIGSWKDWARVAGRHPRHRDLPAGVRRRAALRQDSRLLCGRRFAMIRWTSKVCWTSTGRSDPASGTSSAGRSCSSV